MGYRHIENLYKNQTILVFRECFALEKVHGTSAHIRLRRKIKEGVGLGEDGLPLISEDGRAPAVEIIPFSGGSSGLLFIELFNVEDLKGRFVEAQLTDITLYGEAYGGKMQGMKDTYGSKLQFIVFEVEISGKFLGVEHADFMTQKMGLEFVPYRKISTDLASLESERDLPSRVAVRRGIIEPKMAEGIVLRPPIEIGYDGGEDANFGRIIAKYKRPEFSERPSKRDTMVDPERAVILTKATAIADEWVTPVRLEHVLDKIPTDVEGQHDMSQTGTVIAAMVEDVYREAGNEIVTSGEVRQVIAKRTAQMFKAYIGRALTEPRPIVV